MRIDLHTHSTASDGTETPAELMRTASEAGLDVIALTDHDGISGWAAAAAALPPGLTLLPGIELSAAAREGERTIALHVLGYLVDPENEPLRAECAAIAASRITRAQRIVQAMQDDGLDVRWERIEENATGIVGRPHIASELVRAGLIGDIAEAFTPQWIGSAGRYYRAERKIPVSEAIALIRRAGGVAVFAHPGASGRGATVSDDTIATMTAAGLVGIEVDHPDHDEATRVHLRGLAAELGLLVTGSSDYHGGRKMTRLGENLTAPAVYEAIVERGQGSRPMVAARRGQVDH
jgi:predicted metal-dependent phosphoesterase TrpH